MVETVYRDGCGTYLALRLHQAKGERPCSECMRAEVRRRLEVERVPCRPTPVTEWRPVTPDEAAEHRRVLAAAIGAVDDYPRDAA